MRGTRYIFFLAMLLAFYGGKAQDAGDFDIDELFSQAREKAFGGNREEARTMLRRILERSPDYHDVRILLARTLAWDGRRAEARMELQTVLQKSPQYEDALQALSDVEMWDEKYTQALAVTDRALETYPNNEDFLYKRASILYDLDRDEEALLSLTQLLALNPAHEKGANLMLRIERDNLKYNVGLTYSVDLFSRTYDPAHYAAAHIGRINAWGSAIVRFNYAYRFGENGWQPELDLYPRIADGVYAYVNYGYSESNLFPKHRAGAELFSKLPHSMEVSGGVRYLYFGPETKVSIFTGSLGWYFKQYWISLRPYVTPDDETGTSFSATVFLRRYFEDRDNYIGFSGGAGFTPDDRRIQTGSGLSKDEIYVLKSQRVGISWYKSLRHNLLVNTSLDFVRQELSFEAGQYVWISSIAVGIRKKF